MSELEISNLKYPALEKLGNLVNKAQSSEKGVAQLKQILPLYESLVDNAMEDRLVANMANKSNYQKKMNNVNRPFFTDERGKAMQAVMQRQNQNKANDDYER